MREKFAGDPDCLCRGHERQGSRRRQPRTSPPQHGAVDRPAGSPDPGPGRPAYWPFSCQSDQNNLNRPARADDKYRASSLMPGKLGGLPGGLRTRARPRRQAEINDLIINLANAWALKRWKDLAGGPLAQGRGSQPRPSSEEQRSQPAQNAYPGTEDEFIKKQLTPTTTAPPSGLPNPGQDRRHARAAPAVAARTFATALSRSRKSSTTEAHSSPGARLRHRPGLGPAPSRSRSTTSAPTCRSSARPWRSARPKPTSLTRSGDLIGADALISERPAPAGLAPF